MDMKVNSQTIKRLRETRGWSQEHLSEVAGLSARTVQRIEAEGNASPESRMALAAALAVDAAELGDPPPKVSVASAVPAIATPPDNARSGNWRRHLLVYLTVCAGLVLLDVVQHGALTWARWPLLGWGLGLLLHWLRWRTAPGLGTTDRAH
jgi:transcriptional regulator with XRE-family HTH domain